MNISTIIVYIMLAFMVTGIVDKLCFNNRFGYGKRFEEGVMAMGSLALAMVGIMCFAPILGGVLTPIFTPLYNLIGGDPAMIAGSVLACDMGGYPLAQVMTENPQIQNLSGIYVGAMMGATIVFAIPVSLGIIEERDKPFLAKGFLAGFIAIPFGALTSALVEGIPPLFALVNLVPSIALAILFAIGLTVIPDGMLKGFYVFSKLITILITVCFGAAIIEALAGVQVIPGMDPIAPQIEVVGLIAITLAGAYPMVHCITTVFSKPLMALGRLIGVNDAAAAGMITTLANNIPMFGMLKDMDDKGKVLAVAFSVCADATLGDHLGYASSQAPAVVFPMITGKILGGAIGIVIANLLVVRKSSKAALRGHPVPGGGSEA